MNNLKYDKTVLQNKEVENEKFNNYLLTSNYQRNACFITAPGLSSSRGGLYDVGKESIIKGQTTFASKYDKNVPADAYDELNNLGACQTNFLRQETRRQYEKESIVSDIQVQRFENIKYPNEYQSFASNMFPIGTSSRDIVKNTYTKMQQPY